ncbi:MAG TPA: hypothetical protein VFC46_13135 [Humisphaera sp.]|nr:hypothetical protein [Humisphaera sp.]
MTAYAGAVALLAVHATLSLNDAVRILHTGRRGSDADHRAASGHLKRLCALRRIDEAGVQHLRWLLSHKTDFAYGDRRVGDDEIKAAVSKAEKFAAWVFRSFPEVAHEDEPGARS